MAGYFNYSKSNNAIYAEQQGKYPASRCAEIYGFKSAKIVRESIKSSEWHHTSKRYNITDYYDWPGTLENMELGELNGWLGKFKRNARGREMIAERVREIVQDNLNDKFHLIHLRQKAGYYNPRKRKIQRFAR